MSHNDLFKYLRVADLGLIPHYRSSHIDTTIPNKLFDYMACGLPVIASDAPPMHRIIKATGAGLVYKNGDSSELAKAIIQIYSSKFKYGEKGRIAVYEKYNWAVDEKRLLNIINSL